MPSTKSTWWAITVGIAAFALGYLVSLFVRVDIRLDTDLWALRDATGALGYALGVTFPRDRQFLDRIRNTRSQIPSARSPVVLALGGAAATALGTAGLLAHRDAYLGIVEGAFAGTLILLAGSSYLLGHCSHYLLADTWHRLAPKERPKVQIGGEEDTHDASAEASAAVDSASRPTPTPASDDAASSAPTVPYFVDAPIETPTQDLLGRSTTVDQLLATIGGIQGQSAAYVALEGPWGIGKSSVVALARQRLEELGRVHGGFSGYHFAARERLVHAFFESITSALNVRYATRDVLAVVDAYYGAAKPLFERALGLPLVNLLQGASDPDRKRERLVDLLNDVPRPIVIFIEDMDRLRGNDLLVLFSTLLTAGELPGFVYVLVMDRPVVEEQLDKEVTRGAAFLRKHIHASVRVAPSPPSVVQNILSGYLDAVMEPFAAQIAEGDKRRLLSEDSWEAVVPTVRHAKHLANSFAGTLSQLHAEVNTCDLLLMSILYEFAPSVLDSIAKAPDTWLTVNPRQPGMRTLLRRLARDTPEDPAKSRAAVTQAIENDSLRRAIDSVLANLFPLGASPVEMQRNQRAAHGDYFFKYYEGRVNPGSISDVAARSTIDQINATAKESTSTARELVAATLRDHSASAAEQHDLLDKWAVFADLFNDEAVQSVVLGVADATANVRFETGWFVPDPWDPAREIMFLMIERVDPAERMNLVREALRACTSMEFARQWVAYFNPERNQIARGFESLQLPAVATEFADIVDERVRDGVDFYAVEPQFAAWIVGSAGDKRAAAELTLKLGRLEEVLAAYTSTRPSDDSKHLDRERLCADYDVATLQAKGTKDGASPAVMRFFEMEPCADSPRLRAALREETGTPFDDYLRATAVRAEELLVFLEQWDVLRDELGRSPSADEYAQRWKSTAPEALRSIQELREIAGDFRGPDAILDELWKGTGNAFSGTEGLLTELLKVRVIPWSEAEPNGAVPDQSPGAKN